MVGRLFMERDISAADASRRFSELLRAVREGHSFVVISHGCPVARIVPISENKCVSAKARAALLKRLWSEKAMNIGRWGRDELY